MMSISACCITAPRLAVVAPRPRAPRPSRNRSAGSPARTAWARARPEAEQAPEDGENAVRSDFAVHPAAEQHTGEDGDGELDPEPRVAERWAGHGAKATTL